MPNPSFYSVNLYFIVYLRKSDFAQQFIISGDVFMELHQKSFLKLYFALTQSTVCFFLSSTERSKYCAQSCKRKIHNFNQLQVTSYTWTTLKVRTPLFIKEAVKKLSFFSVQLMT